MKKTLNLLGVTINAMALIAPAALFWTTFQLQSVPGSAMNMWFSVFIATTISIFTAVSYANLANKYPKASTGSSYFFAEASFLEKEKYHTSLARISKFIVGWSSHLYYWIYPGVMVSFMGSLILYILHIFNPQITATITEKMLICVVFAFITGGISYLGITSSTKVNLITNILQGFVLLVFSVLAIAFRLLNPSLHYIHRNALSVVLPHNLDGLIFQSTIAILLMVGFESATAFAAEAKNPKRDIPRGVILSLIIQAVIFYFLSYFAINYVMGNFYTSSSGNGFAAAYNSIAPIGDMAVLIGNKLLWGHGELLAFALAITVVISLVGTVLSSLNTGVRVTYAMGKDTELPTFLGLLHPKYRTPHVTIIVITMFSALIGTFGMMDVNNITQLTMISNIGTFLLYGLTCAICVFAFMNDSHCARWKGILIPVVGLLLNFAMLIGVIYFAVVSGGSSKNNTIIAIIASIVWFIAGFIYMYVKKVKRVISVIRFKEEKVEKAYI